MKLITVQSLLCLSLAFSECMSNVAQHMRSFLLSGTLVHFILLDLVDGGEFLPAGQKKNQIIVNMLT